MDMNGVSSCSCLFLFLLEAKRHRSAEMERPLSIPGLVAPATAGRLLRLTGNTGAGRSAVGSTFMLDQSPPPVKRVARRAAISLCC